jgi:hypothetical protein
MCQHSIALVNDRNLASGTLVKIGQRLLVATAGHALPDDANATHKVTIVPRSESELARPHVIRLAKSPCDKLDVGLVEISSTSLDGFACDPIGLENVNDIGTGNFDRLCWLYGYPGELCETEDGKPQVILLNPFCIPGKPIGPNQWLPLELEFNEFEPESETHVLFIYDRADPPAPGSDSRVDQLPGAKGLSGGGFWQQFAPTPAEQFWTTERIGLFAIQSSCVVRAPGAPSSWKDHPQLWNVSDFLLGIQIIYWLQLVAQIYPDLRTELYDRYPRLRVLASPAAMQ